MFDHGRKLELKKETGGCPFSAIDFRDPLNAFVPLLQTLTEDKISREAISQLAKTVLNRTIPGTPLVDSIKQLSPDNQVAYLAKGALYRLAIEHLRYIKTTTFESKAQAESTHGICHIDSLDRNNRQTILKVTPIDPSKEISKLTDPVQISLAITTPILRATKIISVAYACLLSKEDPKTYKLLSTLLSFLPGRVTKDIGMWLSSGFEGATMLPMDLFRVNFYRTLLQGREQSFSLNDLNVLAENSLGLVKLLANISFDTFNAQREFVSLKRPDGSHQLKHGFFMLHGNSGDPDLHVDYKQIPLAGLFQEETELICGCPGKAWIKEFHDWALDLHEAYFIPNINRMIPGAIKHIKAEGDSSVQETQSLIERINKHHTDGGRPAPFNI